VKKSPDAREHTIVLVDDDKNILTAWGRRLQRWYRVETFPSGESLLAGIEYLSPSLFILDWLMPGMNGLDLCREIRRNHRLDPVPITFFTGVDPSLENIEMAADAGAQAFIAKTTSPDLTALQIRTLVEHHERLERYLKDRAMIISVLKHEISNLLTGVATGVEVMLMNRNRPDDEGAAETRTILEAAREMRALFQDLTEVLSFSREEPSTTVGRERVETVLEDVATYVEKIPRRVTMSADEGEVPCRRRYLARALYYLVRFVDSHLPDEATAFLKAGETGQGWAFSVGGKGNFRAEWEKILSGQFPEGSVPARQDLLFVEYVHNAVRLHHARLTVTGADGISELTLQLPPPGRGAQ